MILQDMKIRCINLDRSTDRWKHVSSAFRDLIRITAVDGMQWSNGSFDEQGRPYWGDVPKDMDPSFRHFKMFPTTYGCNCSHLQAMEHFLATDEQWTIIIEDDTNQWETSRQSRCPTTATGTISLALHTTAAAFLCIQTGRYGQPGHWAPTRFLGVLPSSPF